MQAIKKFGLICSQYLRMRKIKALCKRKLAIMAITV